MPPLEVTTLDGQSWKLAEQKPDSFIMIVFYRGLHCPQCSRYVKGLADQLAEFEQRGVEVIAISTDERERAEQAREQWQLDGLEIGYSLSLGQARAWACTSPTRAA